MSQQVIPFPHKLGKLKPKQDHRLLRLSTYLDKGFTFPTPPPSVDWSKRIVAPNGWGMMGNDKYGDCTCAAAGHLIMCWTAAVGMCFIPSDQFVIGAYAAITGFNPTTGANDDGAVETDVLNYWRKSGIAGHVIGGYAAVDYGTNPLQTQLAIYLFGAAYIGLNLPLTAQSQGMWDVVAGGGVQAEAGSWGGHAVPVLGYDNETLTVITWGVPMKMTWAFYHAYCEEAYAIFSNDFINGKKQSPAGFDLATLQADITNINQAV